MPEHSKSSEEKWRYSVISATLFFIIANPTIYKVVDKIVGSMPMLTKIIGHIAGPAGCPTFVGLILHSIVYMLVIRLLMDAK
jgi:hypothetical protein